MVRKKSKKQDDIIVNDDVIVIDDIVEKQDEVIEKPKLHYVCKAVTSKRGILEKGKYICENDLSGGKDALDRLLKKGIVELR